MSNSTTTPKGRILKEGISKEIMVGRYEPDRRLAQVVVKMKDLVGAMANITGIMADLQVDIRQSATHSLPDGTAVYNAFAILKDPSISRDQLVTKLAQSEFVLDAKVVEGRRGAIIDTASFPVNWQGRRVVILAQPAVARMLEGVRRTFGSGGHVVLYQQGLDYGRDLSKFFVGMFGREYLLKNYDYGLNIINATGWGVPELVNRGFPELTIKLESCFECSGADGGRTVCSFTRGVLAGVFGSLTETAMQCEETHCIGKRDPFCQFELKATKSSPK